MPPQIGDIGDMASINRGWEEENVYLAEATTPKHGWGAGGLLSLERAELEKQSLVSPSLTPGRGE